MIKAAVIGLGWWGQTILKTLLNNAIIAPVLGVDPEEQPRAAAAALGIATAARFEDALANKNVDAVILCTPQQYHAEQIVATRRLGSFGLNHGREFEQPLAVIARVGVDPTAGRAAAIAGDAVTVKAVNPVQAAAALEDFLLEH